MILNEETYSPPPCRSLFSDGQWLIPEAQRPEDWRERTAPKDLPVRREKAPYLAVVIAPPVRKRKPQDFKPGHLKHEGSGTPKRVTITPEEIAAREAAGETVEQIALSIQCHPSVLWVLLKRSNVTRPERTCERCGKPTKKHRQARQCNACIKVDKLEYHKIWARDQRRANGIYPKTAMSPEERRVRRLESNAKWRANQAQIPCSIAGCTNGQFTGGLCSRHESQKRRGKL